jgi:uncharacterized protein (DUF433 family)
MKNLDIPDIVYRRGASGSLAPVLRGTGIRVQTIVLTHQDHTAEEIAEDYDLSLRQVQEALDYYEVHYVEINAYIQAETASERRDE